MSKTIKYKICENEKEIWNHKAIIDSKLDLYSIHQQQCDAGLGQVLTQNTADEKAEAFLTFTKKKLIILNPTFISFSLITNHPKYFCAVLFKDAINSPGPGRHEEEVSSGPHDAVSLSTAQKEIKIKTGEEKHSWRRSKKEIFFFFSLTWRLIHWNWYARIIFYWEVKSSR